MNSYYNDEALTFSRRKLLLKPSALSSDISKAVVLYQPFQGKPIIGRNLVKKEPILECKPQAKCLNTPSGVTQPVPFNPPCPTVNSSGHKKFSFGNNFLLVTILIAIVIFSFNSSKVSDNCEHNSMSVNLKLLEHELTTHLYGQTAAVKTILNMLAEFQVIVDQVTVFVLLGGSGTGKTWTTHLIGNALVSEDVNRVNLHLGSWSTAQDVEEAFRAVECCRWNFLFIEDSDYASIQQIETLLDAVGTLNQNSSCSRRKVVVFLTSNYGQREFAELLLRERDQSGTRWTLSHELLHEVASKLTSSLIDGFVKRKLPFTPVPYLPIEKMQLERCIHHALLLKKKSASPDIVNKIIEHFQFVPPPQNYFVSSGCKTVSSYVNLYSLH